LSSTHDAYQVQLPAFTGPLDLLLQLIEQEELDITTISLAQVTDQYLARIRTLPDIAADELAEFVVVAARLLLIKSRVLLPVSPRASTEDEEDVGEDLVRQLREYKRFKQAALFLEKRDQAGLHAYPRAQPPFAFGPGWEPRLDLSALVVEDLKAALRALLDEQLAMGPSLDVTPYTVTIADKIGHITRCLRSRQSVTFLGLLDDATSKIEAIVTLLAILEMIRSRRVSVRQETLFGEILVVPGELAEGNDSGLQP
jgi:segregation and condensation protein A